MVRLTLGFLVVVGTGGAFFGVKTRSAAIPHSPRIHQLAERRECPHTWDKSRFNLPVAGAKANVPEFNDCQRFLVKRSGGLAYSDLFAVFASEKLDSLESRAAHSPFAYVGAEVWGEGQYKPLGIGRGHNCLYMWKSAGKWQATMIALGTRSCRDSIPITAARQTGRSLKVMPDTFPNLVFTDYPAVARWDWDSTNSTQYVGLKCGAAWCEVGDANLRPSAGFRDPGGDNATRRVRLVKGWYDQQYLATLPEGVTPAASPVPVPTTTTVLATIWPVPELGNLNSWENFRTFRTVAHIEYSANTSDMTALHVYRDRLGFIAHPGRVTGIDIALCYGNPATCEIATAAVPTSCDPEGPGDDPPPPTAAPAVASTAVMAAGNRWYARVSTGAGQPKFHCSQRWNGEADGIPIPGTTRWRWKADDEGGWFRCLYGCCELT